MLCAETLLVLMLSSPPQGIPSEALLNAVAMKEGNLTPSQVRRPRVVPDGTYGEVSMYQLTPDVCDQLHVSVNRVRLDPAFARRCCARLLTILYEKTGSWKGALAAYHRGLNGRRSFAARDYAQCVLNLAAAYH